MQTLEDVARALRALSALAGSPVIWKTLTMWHIRHCAMEECLYHHCHPWCLAVKQHAFDLCRRDDATVAMLDAAKSGKTFVKTCHSGVVECVVPVVADGTVTGFLFAGPFRTRDGQCGKTGDRSAFRRLPGFEPLAEKGFVALLECVACGLSGIHPPTGGGDRVTDPRIRTALAYMRRHHAGHLDASRVAKSCCLSLSRFIHLFARETGMPFRRALLDIRVEAARRLLAEQHVDKAQVALRVGFCDQSHFCAAFRRMTGLTPGAYQRYLARQKNC